MILKKILKSISVCKILLPELPAPNIITIAGPVDAMAQSETGPTPNF